MRRRNQMLAVLKYVNRETVAITTEMVSAVKVLIVNINTLHPWLSITGSVSNTSSGLGSVLSIIHIQEM